MLRLDLQLTLDEFTRYGLSALVDGLYDAIDQLGEQEKQHGETKELPDEINLHIKDDYVSGSLVVSKVVE